MTPVCKNIDLAGRRQIISEPVTTSMSLERHLYRTNFEEVTRAAREATLKYGEHKPLLIIDGSKNLFVSRFQEIPGTHEQRIDLMHSIGQIVAESGKIGQLWQVFLVSEGWMSLAREGNPPKMRPSQDPNRKDVLIISGLQLETRQKYLRLFELVRNQEKQIVDLQELISPAGKEGSVDIPLLEAFAQGFNLALKSRFN